MAAFTLKISNPLIALIVSNRCIILVIAGELPPLHFAWNVMVELGHLLPDYFSCPMVV